MFFQPLFASSVTGEMLIKQVEKGFQPPCVDVGSLLQPSRYVTTAKEPTALYYTATDISTAGYSRRS